MTMFNVTFMRGKEKYRTCLAGRNEDEIKIFVRTHYRRVIGKILYVRRIKTK